MSASPPAALPLVSRSDALHARSCALLGSVNLKSLRAAVPFEQVSTAGRVVFTAPGIELQADPARATWLLQGHRLTICLGGDVRAAAEGIGVPAASAGLTLSGRGAVIHVDLAQGICLLATDRFAVQPLCFAHASDTLRFSERADAVLPESERQIDPQAIYNYFYFHVIPSPRTIFRGVQRLGPSELLTASPSGLKRSRHWRPRFDAGDADVGALKSEFREAVRTAVAREATGAAGCFLSGGTDSSTVAGMLSRLRGEPVRAFSIGFDAAGYDEMAYARIAARHFGLEHHEYYVTPADLVRAMPQVAAHFDQPFGNSSAVPAHYCVLLAKSHGVTRMLAGDGGDELFGGNSRYAKQKVFDAYGALPHALRTSLVEPLLLGTGWPGRVPVVRKAVSYVKQARTPMPDRAAAYNLLEYIGAARVLEARLLEQVDTDEPLALQRAVYAECEARSPVDRELAFDWRFTLADNDLPKVVGSTELAGLQAAFPLLSDAIVDLSLRLPASQKVRGLTLRHFFKSALSDFLPPEILRKKKHGFGLPFGQWLVADRALNSYARSAVERLAERGIIRAGLPGEVFDSLLPQHPKYYGELVWIMTMLEGWLTVHHPERNGL